MATGNTYKVSAAFAAWLLQTNERQRKELTELRAEILELQLKLDCKRRNSGRSRIRQWLAND